MSKKRNNSNADVMEFATSTSPEFDLDFVQDHAIVPAGTHGMDLALATLGCKFGKFYPERIRESKPLPYNAALDPSRPIVPLDNIDWAKQARLPIGNPNQGMNDGLSVRGAIVAGAGVGSKDKRS